MKVSQRRYVHPKKGRHQLIQGDSLQFSFSPTFDLVITSPPFFHPRTVSRVHGSPSPTRDLDEYAHWVASILAQIHIDPAHQTLCVVKTDVRYKTATLPVGLRILDACLRSGMILRAHWIWERMRRFSPYAPSISNIFVFGQCGRAKLQHPGVFKTDDLKNRSTSSSFTPELFRQLMVQLSLDGETVLDPFAGVGSCLIAASQCNRWSVSVEIDPTQIEKAKTLLAGWGVSDTEYHLG
jgi:DNA modification methylase